MEPDDLIHILRERSTESKRLAETPDRKSIIQRMLEERDKIYLHRKTRPVWIPSIYRISMTKLMDNEPSNYPSKLFNLWGTKSLGVQVLNYYDWRPAFTYYTDAAKRADIPPAFRSGIYSLFLAEYAHFFIKDLKSKIHQQNQKVIPLEYRSEHKEASEDKFKKVLIDSGEYVDSMKVSYGPGKITLTVEHERHPENSKITFLQLARMLEFGTSRMPAYAHWRRLINHHKQGISKDFMKYFLHMYLDIPKIHL